MLLLSAGIRRSEAVSITLDDLDLENPQLLIRVKGDKQRVVPLTEQAVEISRLVRRDATISLRGQHYAAPPELMGKHVWVGLLGDDILIEHAGRTVATYTR